MAGVSRCKHESFVSQIASCTLIDLKFLSLLRAPYRHLLQYFFTECDETFKENCKVHFYLVSEEDGIEARKSSIFIERFTNGSNLLGLK